MMFNAANKPQRKLRVLLSKPMEFELFADSSGRQFLKVLCGGIGAFEVCIALTAEEVERYVELGDSFVEKLALDIQRSPQTFASRAFSMPPGA